jgi:hypothetical protein
MYGFLSSRNSIRGYQTFGCHDIEGSRFCIVAVSISKMELCSSNGIVLRFKALLDSSMTSAPK